MSPWFNLSRILRIAVLWLALPSLHCAPTNMPCYYSPIVEKEKEGSFELVSTTCPPSELCFKADGRYGNYSALSARGCMAESECGRIRIISLKGTVYTMTFNCCSGPYCNSCPTATATPVILTLASSFLALITVRL